MEEEIEIYKEWFDHLTRDEKTIVLDMLELARKFGYEQGQAEQLNQIGLN
jgi:hypothetical protein